MAQSRDLLSCYGEQQMLLQRLSENCARIEVQLEKNQHVLSDPAQFSTGTPLRAQDQSVDLLNLPMPVATSISIPPASTSPTIRQWEPDNRPFEIPQPAIVTSGFFFERRHSNSRARTGRVAAFTTCRESATTTNSRGGIGRLCAERSTASAYARRTIHGP